MYATFYTALTLMRFMRGVKVGRVDTRRTSSTTNTYLKIGFRTTVEAELALRRINTFFKFLQQIAGLLIFAKVCILLDELLYLLMKGAAHHTGVRMRLSNN